MLNYPWNKADNIYTPKSMLSLFEIKRRFLSERYSDKGRPKKTDYDIKSIKDCIFEMDLSYSKKLDDQILK
jgi:hypothetical protein